MTSPETILSERSLSVFRSLVEHYIRDGLPVSSRALAEDSHFDLSTATIRNIMASLERVGLLQAPHTSAGRIPTAKGYRLFVDSLLQVRRPPDHELRRIYAEMAGETDRQLLIERTCELLSRITRLASVVMLPKKQRLTVHAVEFVPLQENQLLVVLVMEDRQVLHRIIDARRRYTPARLQQASNYLNELLCAFDLKSIRKRLLQEMKNTRNDLGRLMQQAVEFAEQAYSSADGGGDDYVMSGETNLMDLAEFCDVDRLKRLFQSFHQKQDILHLLDQAIRVQGVQILIGDESGCKEFDDCSLVITSYEVEGQPAGVLGVIGPTRIPYSHVIPIVDVTARLLGTSLNSRH